VRASHPVLIELVHDAAMLSTGSATTLLIEIRGLPAHALLVHLTVVIVPVAALGAVAYLVPGWRDWLRWPLLVAAVLAGVSIWAAYLTGDNFKESVKGFQANPLVEEHEELADVLRIVGTVFTLVVVGVVGWLHRGSATLRTVGSVVAAALAVVTLVYVVLTGEAGAKAVYPPGSFDSAPVSTR
jgi:uncharacterized membrane protein